MFIIELYDSTIINIIVHEKLFTEELHFSLKDQVMEVNYVDNKLDDS